MSGNDYNVCECLACVSLALLIVGVGIVLIKGVFGRDTVIRL